MRVAAKNLSPDTTAVEKVCVQYFDVEFSILQ